MARRPNSSATRGTACARSRRCSMSRAPGMQSARWRRCAGARAGARLRTATARRFGRPLAEQPLHQDDAGRIMQAEFEAAFHLTFYVAELLGRAQTGHGRHGTTELAAPAHAAGETVDRQARRRDRIGSLRMLRRRRLHRRHRHAAIAARRAGVFDLGRHDATCWRWISCVRCIGTGGVADPARCASRVARGSRIRRTRPPASKARGRPRNSSRQVCNRSPAIASARSRRTRHCHGLCTRSRAELARAPCGLGTGQRKRCAPRCCRTALRRVAAAAGGAPV